jgi:DNA-binding NtrC family response regulator
VIAFAFPSDGYSLHGFPALRRKVSVTIDGQLQRIIDELVSKGIPLEAAKKEFERKYVTAAVTKASGNMGRAAKSLGIHRNTLRAKISLLKVKPPLRGRDNS